VTLRVKRHRRKLPPERLVTVVWHEGRRLTFPNEGDYVRWRATAGVHEVQKLRVIEGEGLSG
jgi:hypothetical protein